MTCKLCEREIPKAHVDRGSYVYSRHTGEHYCLRQDCRHIRRRLRKKAA